MAHNKRTPTARAPARAKSRTAASSAASRRSAKAADAEAEAQAFAALHFIDSEGRRDRQWLNFPPRGWAALEEAAMEWNYVLRSRRRWVSTRASEDHIQRATETLWSFAVTPDRIEALARARHIEVRMAAAADDDGGWSLRIFPWEYIIAAATRPYRHGNALTITRTLDVHRKEPLPRARLAPRPGRQSLRVLHVESAPGDIGKTYDFQGERQLLRTYLTERGAAGNGGATGSRLERLYSPTLEQLAATVKAFKPHIVHLSGIDSHEAGLRQRWQSRDAQSRGTTAEAATLGTLGDVTDQHDGYILTDVMGRPTPAGPKQLAQALTADRQWFPWLVCMNLENSASRLAARTVQWGCAAAVGIQDAVDTGVAEIFFGTLYSALRDRWDVASAFREAWGVAREQPDDLVGTGLVLWTDSPRIGVPATPAKGAAGRASTSRQLRLELPEAHALQWVRDRVGVKIRPKPAINYALLHNGDTLFEEFSLMPAPGSQLSDVTVRAVLRAGLDNAEYLCAIDLKGHPVDLRHRIHVALGADLIRSVHEAINTTWLVEITWGPHVLLRDTYPVRLLPIDQWRDAASSRSWLPSFVFPRDRAVTQIITKASNYVRVLRDDPSAGFEGYQCLPNKERLLPTDAQEVDLQVQAIWSTILYEWRLTYVNPPPTYSRELDSQRLRTPTIIARERVGTCIDLALLMAAALELVDIRPVVFLWEGHAFPGYWRADTFHERFSQATPEEGTIREITGIQEDSTGVGGIQRYPWAVGRAMVREILLEIRSGRLVPLETVRLTENAGFAEAVEAGKAHFTVPDQFEFLIDIAIARLHDITPLPLLGDEP